MFQQQATTSIGTAFVYAEGFLPSWAFLGDYDNGSASGNARSEYIWLPTGEGAIPVVLDRYKSPPNLAEPFGNLGNERRTQTLL